MRYRKGFTLLELLIAAAIMSALAILATSSYRKSVAETRIQDAKNRLQAVAGAMHRFMLDHPNATYAGADELLYLTTDQDTCSKSPAFSAAKLIQCGYLENRQWSDNYIVFVTCGGAKSGSLCENSTLSFPLACMSGRNASFGDRYLMSKGYRYCLDSSGEVDEHIGSAS